MPIDLGNPRFDPAMVSLPELQAAVWAELAHACGNSQHAWRLPCLGSVWNDAPQQRIVVLRQVDHATCQLFAHSDLRTFKIKQFQQNPGASWLFYHPEHRIQLRMSGTMKLHVADAIADQHWAQLGTELRVPYLAPFPPGEACDDPSINLPPGMLDAVPQAKDVQAGRAHFAVLATRIDELDLLFLRHSGHLRAKLIHHATGWQRTWVQP